MSLREQRIADLKQRLLDLMNELNSSGARLEFHQQKVVTAHMCLMGGNGSLWIEPNSVGYDIVLGGQSLQKQMYSFMRDLCGRECDGYKQKNARLGRKDFPFWRVVDFSMVQISAAHYAKTSR